MILNAPMLVQLKTYFFVWEKDAEIVCNFLVSHVVWIEKDSNEQVSPFSKVFLIYINPQLNAFNNGL